MEYGPPCYDELWLDAIEMSDLAHVGQGWGRVYPVWSLRVAHVDLMGWSILARLGNLDALSTVSSRSKCSNGII